VLPDYCRSTTSQPDFQAYLAGVHKGKYHMIHAWHGVAAIALAAAVAAGGAQAQIQTELPPGPTVWDHNGSVVYLVANGASREFYYQKPRPGMLDVGARPGSLLFRGQINSGQYLGTAYIFNAHCGPIPFEVKGSSLEGDERIVLTGQAPQVGRNCRTHGSYTSTLEFRRAKLDEANHSQKELTAALPPVVASKPELKADVSPTQGREVPSPPNETPSTPKISSPGLVNTTGVSTSTDETSVPNKDQPAKDPDQYLWGAAFIVLIVWLLIKLFGKKLIGVK
jgi:hypothetical protein